MSQRGSGAQAPARPSATATLARYVQDLAFEDLPENVAHEARRAFLNWLGCALAAAPEDAVRIACEVMTEAGAAQVATAVGLGRRLDSGGAALVNGVAAHLYDFDDTHARSILHPSAATAAACLALTEQLDLTGDAYLTAFVAGTEVACRIAAAVTPEHNDAGWHVTGTVGTFGAAAAASKLLGLSTDQTAAALGLAATQAAGLREMFGSMAKPLHPGKAAWNGLLAARLARRGFTASAEGLEGRRGFLAVMSPDADRDAIVAGLGSDWETLANRYKPYACGVVTHAAIDAAIEARRRGIAPSEIERIEAHVHPLVKELTAKTDLRSGLEGKFSVFHCVAVGLLDGRAGPEQFTDARVVAPEVVALAAKVNLVVEPAMGEESARLIVHLHGGRQETIDVRSASGSLERPMSDRDLEDKFTMMVADFRGSNRAGEVIDAVWAVGPATSMRELARSLPVLVEAA